MAFIARSLTLTSRSTTSRHGIIFGGKRDRSRDAVLVVWSLEKVYARIRLEGARTHQFDIQ
eukprot:scaffold65474_cov45-Attheya_sp.AAC.3